jgi:hypothetical protein
VQRNKLTTLGEDTMSKNNTAKLDMFLEGIESVEVAKKPKFHSIYRLYEAKEDDLEDQEEVQENEEEAESDSDDVKIDSEEEPDGDEDGGEAESDHDEPDGDESEGEDDESDGDESEGEDDESDESDESDDEENIEEGVGDVYNAIKGWLNTNPAEAKRIAALAARNKAAFEKAMMGIASFADKPLAAAPASARNEYRRNRAEAEKEGWVGEEEGSDELDEGSQGYAAGLKGVRKDAGAKKLKSGTNKVPTPKVQITGDKKLLKKPTVAKGDSYPNSSVAGKKGAKK